jgi:hypothetical protein
MANGLIFHTLHHAALTPYPSPKGRGEIFKTRSNRVRLSTTDSRNHEEAKQRRSDRKNSDLIRDFVVLTFRGESP